MKADSSELRALLRLKRKNYFVCVAFLLGGLAFHGVMVERLDPRLVASQLVWATLFAVLGVCVGRGWLPPHWSAVMAGLIGLVAATIFVMLSGGAASPYFQVFAAIPFFIAMFTPTARMPTLLGGVLMLGVVVLVDWMGHVPPRVLVLQAGGFALLVGVALFGARTYRRMWDGQRAAQQERLVMLEQLAESERRRMRAERERAEVERLVLVGQLAAGVAHEVNNPLAFVKSNLSYLEHEARGGREALDMEEMRSVLAETQQGVLRIQQIVMDLRRFSRGEQEGDCPGPPEDALHEARRMASVRLREGEVAVEVSEGLPAVRLGQRHLVQVVLNLLLNAADAVEMAEPARQVRIGMRARAWEGGVRVVVEDNGPGIAPEVLPRLFEPFFTTKPPGKGTGLGLALCREYVTRAGGTLHAENRAEGGARFVLLLPGAAAPVPA